MKKQRQNVRSTKQKTVIYETSEDEALTQAVAKHNILIKVVNAHNTVYSDQTGRLLVQSNRGNCFLMVFYDVNTNYINVEPMKDHRDNSMIQAYQNLWARTMQNQKEKPSLHILDNEASTNFKTAIKTNCNLQLIPPDTHQQSLAERAIQTFKSHFIAILAGVDPTFPMNLWDHLVPQTVVTLNQSRQSNVATTMSAYQHVNGPFDYNKMPLAPLGCAVQMHESTSR